MLSSVLRDPRAMMKTTWKQSQNCNDNQITKLTFSLDKQGHHPENEWGFGAADGHGIDGFPCLPGWSSSW